MNVVKLNGVVYVNKVPFIDGTKELIRFIFCLASCIIVENLNLSNLTAHTDHPYSYHML
ncbi:hypothetical protein [Alicyclobacillus dauci]|uniref:Uncharacterized protein n=1 Tax=Alicyclobacillus dauci TaxID=1475485 RepID=A0ABY6Z1U2_9BACL|nr:hypothetical protein [Alicyclobacillus dauci]WAH36796.1 hypothetical protein NZD86_21920 [Alicyclobacillus dauci]